MSLPKILVIDDQFGRQGKGGDRDRKRLCNIFNLLDISDHEKNSSSCEEEFLAEVTFCRAQTPACSVVGDTVENDLAGCLQSVEKGWCVDSGELPWSLVLLDLCFYTGMVTKESDRRNLGMPEGRSGEDRPEGYFGLTILQALQERFPELPVIILSSMPRDKVSKQFSTCGALGFLDRVADESPALLKDYLFRHGLIPDTTGNVLGYSKAILLALRSARRVARSRQNVLIRGPRGSGKGLIAKYIHANSEQLESPFVSIILSGTNPDLYESLLFGQVKGAFTGAEERKGRIVEANNGVLFLDEIASLPDKVQYGLLHVLEDDYVRPLGGSKTTKVDVHFISATNEDIEGRAASGQGFRSDLLDRIREGGTLCMPPLSKHKEDIPMLVERFVRKAEEYFSSAYKRHIAPEALEKLAQYDWPGNIRELRHCVFNAVNANLDVEHLVHNHVHLPEEKSPTQTSEKKQQGDQVHAQESLTELSDVMQLISEYNFSSLNHDDLTGRLDEIELACRQFIAHYLKATLEKTLTPIKGEVKITPAIKMATGNTQIKTSKAADMIKRLLKGLDCSLPQDQILRRALERAIETRQKKN
ncbi:sigma-54-dependent Fis family transcriptional regulator [Candidatus Latescibacterota bacterium]